MSETKLAQGRTAFLLPLFYLILLLTLIEAAFNRIFLATVIPIGLSGADVGRVAPAITAFYIVGGYSYSTLTFVVPATVFIAAILSRAQRLRDRVFYLFVMLSVLFSVILDVEHWTYGLGSVYQNASPLLSVLLLSSSCLALVVMCTKLAGFGAPLAVPLGLMLGGDLLGYVFLLGNILTSSYLVPGGTLVASAGVQAEPYIASAAGAAFMIGMGSLVIKGERRLVVAYFCALAVGVALEVLLMTNALPGSLTLFGTILIYNFGFLGVTDANVAFVVFFAILAFITAAFGMARRGSPATFGASLGAMIIMLTAFVYLSESVTTYILLPLTAAVALDVSLSAAR